MKLDLQDEIPQELYKVVAEILSFAYRLNRKAMGKNRPE
jgi:type III secretion system FlhB-like substrate exporter